MTTVVDSPGASHACTDGGRPLYAPGDVYCRMCGSRLLSYVITPPPGGEIVCVAGVEESARRDITISTSGSVYPLPVRVEAGHPAIRITSGARDFVSSTLNPGSAIVIDVHADVENAQIADALDTELRVLFPGTKLAPVAVPVRLGRQPVVEAEAVDLGTVKRGGVARSVVRVRHRRGISMRVLDVDAKAGFTATGLAAGHRVSSGDTLEFAVEGEADMLGTGEHTSELVIDWDTGTRTRVPLRLAVARSAELTLTGKGSRDVPQGLSSGDLWVVLRNDSPFDVTVTEVRVAQAVPWFRMDAAAYPLRIPTEQTHQIRCHVDATSMPLGTYTIDLTATIEEGGAAKYQLTGRVIELRPYPHVVAIDLGTTSSCVAYWTERTIHLVPFRDPATGLVDTVVPSVAFFDPHEKRWLAGFEARQAAVAAGRSELLVRSVKRLLNRGRFESSQDGGRMDLGGRYVAPETIVAEIFRYLKRHTEQHLKAALDTVVLTLPANFTDGGVRALLRAAGAAGLKPFTSEIGDVWERHRIDEPTAAAIDTAQTHTAPSAANEEERVVVVFDFGGGTLDVSVLLMSLADRERRVDVMAHKGANGLGGDEFTREMVALFARDFRKAFPGQVLRHDVTELKESGAWDDLDDVEKGEAFTNAHLLWEQAEDAKIELTTALSVTKQVLVHVRGKERVFTADITRAAFNEQVSALVEQAADMVERAVRSCRRRPIELSAIDEVILTGRASLVPLVREAVEKRTKRKPITPSQVSGPKECVARGACWYGMETLKKGQASGTRRLVLSGIHEYTNSSYGFDVTVAEGYQSKYVFVPVIPEGIELHRGSGLPQQTFKKTAARVNGAGAAQITIYQHAGDLADDVIDDNPEIVAIDTIDVRGIRMPDPRNPPEVEVEMWIAPDGLLDAVARVAGHDRAFPLESRYRV